MAPWARFCGQSLFVLRCTQGNPSGTFVVQPVIAHRYLDCHSGSHCHNVDGADGCIPTVWEGGHGPRIDVGDGFCIRRKLMTRPRRDGVEKGWPRAQEDGLTARKNTRDDRAVAIESDGVVHPWRGSDDPNVPWLRATADLGGIA